MHGVYGLDYYHVRKTSRALRYRLRRRTDEVERALRRYVEGRLQTVVDVGTADALMLATLRERLGHLSFIGLEMSRELLLASHDRATRKLQADALSLPIRSGVADAVVATAVLEHVEHPGQMMAETFRVLRPGGILVLTTPEPTLERISAALGLLKEARHSHTFNLRQLQQIATGAGYVVVEAGKFMFSPIGFPAEKFLERVLGPLGLELLMANQLLVARKA